MTIATRMYPNGCVRRPSGKITTSGIWYLLQDATCVGCQAAMERGSMVVQGVPDGRRGYLCEACAPWHVRPSEENGTFTPYIGPLPERPCWVCEWLLTPDAKAMDEPVCTRCHGTGREPEPEDVIELTDEQHWDAMKDAASL